MNFFKMCYRNLFFFVFYSLISAIFSEVIVVKPNLSNLYRPCNFDDLACLKHQLHKHRWCPKHHNPYKTPLEVTEIKSFAPAYNATAVDKHVTFSGLQNGYVTEFYINRITGEVLLTIDFKNIEVVTDSYFELKNSRTEDLVVVVTDTSAVYPHIVVRAKSSGKSRFKPSVESIYTNVVQLPVYEFPGLNDITDPAIKHKFTQIDNLLNVGIQELFVTRGVFLAKYFIKNIICYHDDH